MAYYVICDDDSKHEAMTKEQILAAITQAIETGSIGDCDTGFVTKIKEKNGGRYVTFWVGTQAQYNAIAEKEENCMYIITDSANSFDGFVPIDISDKVEFEMVANNVEIENPTLQIARMVYVPALRIVFYGITLSWGACSIKKDKYIFFQNKKMTYGSSAADGLNVGSENYFGVDVSDNYRLKFLAVNDITASGKESYNGWYFCDGE